MSTQTIVRPITDGAYTALMQLVRPHSSEELFEFQRTRLADEKLAETGMFDRFANILPRLPKHGLFLLVPPQPRSPDWNELMARVELDGMTGLNLLDREYHKDIIEVPDVPTVLIGVEDGRGRRNINPSVSRKAIPAEGRTAYYTWRGYIHVFLFPMVLKHHNMDMVGSLCKNDCVPDFYLCADGPALGEHWHDDAAPDWGAPSCVGSIER